MATDETLKDRVDNICDYLNLEVGVESFVASLDLLDALATYGYTVVEDPSASDPTIVVTEASAEYMAQIIEARDES